MSNQTKHPDVARAEALLEVGRPEEARALLYTYLNVHQHDAVAWTLTAACFIDMRKWGGALNTAEVALRVNPEHAMAHIHRSTALLKLGRAREAVAAAREAGRLAPHHWLPHAALSHALRGAGAFPEALAAGEESIRLAPEQTVPYFARYFALLALGERERAMQTMHEVLRIDPGNANAHNNLAADRLDDKGGDLFAATEDLAIALAHNPTSQWSRHNLEVIAYRMLRRARWLALGCLLVALAAMVVADAAQEEKLTRLPLPYQLAALAVMAGGWAVWAARTYLKLPPRMRAPMRGLPRRSYPAGAMAFGAVWCTLCAVLLVVTPLLDTWAFAAFLHAGWGVLLLSAASAEREVRRRAQAVR
ncbi:hypothetical protein [Streptomyces palmae]|uniref:Uncharacterized protein n=1 Tax=Streptomyces palmae TaxID=1701085 RepID=A0A4Z0G4N4_9ACTN|nr:hypothetical protein [Streptomyces palmae]TGA89750.1 hypothetical protein E4099_29050 [Streptomyces palmae]